MRLLPFVAFFLSGTSSLIFQLIWTRLLHHVFGATSVAISSVVSVFMGGLALGAWAFGKWADRIRRPLRVYALVEVGVGCFALAIPWLVDPEGWLSQVNAMLRHRLGAESTAFMLARFACIVPILIVPTTLMGSTLPLLARHLVGPEQGAGGASARVGALYAVNTVGAVCGVLLAGFALLPHLGVWRANLVAASLNFGLALMILCLGERLSMRDEGAAAGPVAAPAETHPRRVRLVAAVTFGLSGVAALLYEVVWSRALVNAIGASVYSFALILATFLVGIGRGSGAAAWLLRAGAARTVAGLALAAAPLSILALVPLGLRAGLTPFFAGGAVSAAGLLAIVRAARRRQRQTELLAGPHEASRLGPQAYAVLAVPLLLSLVQAAYWGKRLEWMATTVVGINVVLLLLLSGLARRPVFLLAALQLLIGGATFASDLWADQLSLTFASMVAPLYHQLAEHVDVVMAIMFTTVALCVLPAALAMGASFPVTMRIWTSGGERIGRDVGVVYTGNTVGSIVGAWLPGFVLVPAFGMQGTLHLGIGLNLLLALSVILVWATARRPPERGPRLVAYATCALVPLLLSGLYLATVRADSFVRWNLSKMTLGAFRISLARDVLDEEAWGEPDLVYYRDGLSTTVSVERWGRHFSLKNNGKVEASNGDDMPTQIMVSAVPLLMHGQGPEDLDVAIIGLGSGVTVGAALQFPVQRVDVVELERAVVDASRFFADVNHLSYGLEEYPYIDNPRLSLFNDDGRNFLAASARRYDVIVSEPSNPWITGVSDLFTVDHFRISKQKLAPDGVYCQWVQLYELSPNTVKVIYRTFASQFEYVVVFSAEDLSSDTLLVGSDAPLRFDLQRVRRAFEQPSVAAELERAYIHRPHDVFARVLLSSKREVLQYAQHEWRRVDGRWEPQPASTNHGPCPAETCRRVAAPLNTDDNALVEFRAPRDLIAFERYKGYLDSVYAASWPYGALEGLLEGFGQGDRAATELAHQALALLAHGRKPEAAVMIDAAAEQGQSPVLERARELWQGLSSDAGKPVIDVPPLSVVSAGLEGRAAARLRRTHAAVADWVSRGEPGRALSELETLPRTLMARAGPELALLRAYLLYESAEFDEVITQLESVAREEQGFALTHPELYYYLARAHDARLHFDKALRNMRVYVDARRMLPRVWLQEPPEPPASAAPTTDAPGQTLKERHRPPA